MHTTVLRVRTGRSEAIYDLTADCSRFVAEEAGPASEGLLNIFVPHATAGLAILELGSGADDDLLAVLAEILPRTDRWQHRHGSMGHGRSHVLPALLPPFAVLPVLGGRIALGSWQSVALVDLNVDNPEREVRLSLVVNQDG